MMIREEIDNEKGSQDSLEFFVSPTPHSFLFWVLYLCLWGGTCVNLLGNLGAVESRGVCNRVINKCVNGRKCMNGIV